jgi:hypothetical protein
MSRSQQACGCVPLSYGRAHGRPKHARLTHRDECTCDRAAVGYTRSA